MRHILHENADPIPTLNTPRLKPRRNGVRKTQNVGVGIFFDPIGMIEHKRATLWASPGPVFQTMEDPGAGHTGVDGQAGNLSPCIHAPVE